MVQEQHAALLADRAAVIATLSASEAELRTSQANAARLLSLEDTLRTELAAASTRATEAESDLAALRLQFSNAHDEDTAQLESLKGSESAAVRGLALFEVTVEKLSNELDVLRAKLDYSTAADMQALEAVNAELAAANAEQASLRERLEALMQEHSAIVNEHAHAVTQVTAIKMMADESVADVIAQAQEMITNSQAEGNANVACAHEELERTMMRIGTELVNAGIKATNEEAARWVHDAREDAQKAAAESLRVFQESAAQQLARADAEIKRTHDKCESALARAADEVNASNAKLDAALERSRADVAAARAELLAERQAAEKNVVFAQNRAEASLEVLHAAKTACDELTAMKAQFDATLHV